MVLGDLRGRLGVPIGAEQAMELGLVTLAPDDLDWEDELRLALSHAGIAPPPIASVRRLGGNLPQQGDILACIRETQEVHA